MTTSASALPALPTTNTDPRQISERINRLIREFNRPDLFVPSYAPDTGSGTAYVTAPSTDIKVYEIGQTFDFKAANANTSTTPTLNVNSLGAGTISKASGALALGDIGANTFNSVIVTSTTPTFQLLSQGSNASFVASGATTFLQADVNVTAANTFISGPNTGALVAGTYMISALASVLNNSTTATGTARINNGSGDIIDSAATIAGGFAGSIAIPPLVVVIGSSTTFTLQYTDNVGTSTTTLKTTAVNGTAHLATSITAVRIA